MPTAVITKKACCKDKPRCKRCPVVLKRLADAGLAERVGKRSYRLSDDLTKKDLKVARRPRTQAAR
jgi:DNA-binding transcriptional regulator PaaX